VQKTNDAVHMCQMIGFERVHENYECYYQEREDLIFAAGIF